MTDYTTLITTSDAAQHLDDPTWAFVDCRFQLDDADAGRRSYLDAHIPGAVYAHLDTALSGPIVLGETGRHPLPTVDAFAETLCTWGIDASTQVVAYDTFSGVYAGRLWWMLRWLGHDKVAVLDGDFRLWQSEERPTLSGEESRSRREFVANLRPDMAVSVEEVAANIESKQYQVYDSRYEGRFRGEPSPMDPVSGHIPGARSAFFAHNLDEHGQFLPTADLRNRFKGLLDGAEPSDTIWYCGSGVSVHHNLLAMEVAGFGRGAKVYIGSWSDWITDSSRPIATDD